MKHRADWFNFEDLCWNSFAKCKNEKFDCPKGYLAQFLLINLHINTIVEVEH